MPNAIQGCAFVVLSLLLVACVSTETKIVQRVEQALAEQPDNSVPLIVDEGMSLVPVFIDGHGPLMFVLDTGASISVLSPSTRDLLGFSEDDGGTANITGASGRGDFQALHLDSVAVGGHTMEDLRVVVLDLAAYQRSSLRYGGILGNDVLEHFDFTYDLMNEKLHLYPHEDGSVQPIAGLDTLNRIPFDQKEMGSGFIVLDLSVGGYPAEGIFDTGSRHSVVNWNAAFLDGARGERGRGTQETLGIGHEGATVTDRYTFNNIRANMVAFTPTEVSIADLPIFRALDLSDRPAVLFGNDIVKDRLVVVSYSTRHLYFSDPLTE